MNHVLTLAPGTPSDPAQAGYWLPAGGLSVLLLLAVAWLILRRLERVHDAMALRALRAGTDRAIAESDAAWFFALCRAAVQAKLAERWGSSPGSITLAEMRERGIAAPLIELFEIADAVAYSGRPVQQDEMRRWQEVLLAELPRLG